MKQIAHQPPAVDLEAEQAVLGAVLLKPQMMEEVADLLLDEDFYQPGHRLIYRAMSELYAAGKPIDLTTLAVTLKQKNELDVAGGAVFLVGLSEQVGVAANAFHYAQVVYDNAMKRRLWSTCNNLAHACLEKNRQTKELLDHAESSVFSLSHTYLHGKMRTLSEIMSEEKQRLGKLKGQVGGKLLSGVDTGFLDLNDMTFGWQSGDLVVLGGRPGHGKTALSLNFALNAALTGQPAVFFSLEMPEGQLTQRLFSCHGGISGDSLRSGNISAEDWVYLDHAIQELDQLPLWILAGTKSILEIKSLARRVRAQAGGLGLVVIDYLGRIIPVRPGRSKYEEISVITKQAKDLAMELHVPVILNAQLNRKLEERRDRRPLMSDLRDSGEIEQDADMVMFIYRDELYNEKAEQGIAEILVRKQRSGRTGNFKLLFRSDLSRFENFTQEEVPF